MFSFVAMKLVTTKQIQAIDRAAIDGRGIPGLELMENAGRGIAEYVRELTGGDVSSKRFLIFCGKGNNGGDGFVIGRYLHGWGASVTFMLIGRTVDLKGDAKVNFERARDLSLEVVEIQSESNLPDRLDADMLVDAIFGTGFKGDIRGVAAPAVSLMNDSGIPILAVDAPSGLDCDAGKISGACIWADATATLALPKAGQFIYPGREHVGALKVIDIGIPSDIVEQAGINLNLIDETFVISRLPRRAPTVHKGACGKLFVLAGSRGYTGAACMASESAIRSGVGLCFLGIPSSLNPICEMKLTEVMTRPLPEVKKRECLALRGLGEVRKEFVGMNAGIIGPGLGTHHETKELVRRLLKSVELPVLLDADGLNAFEEHPDDLAAVDAPLILTPHPGELSRLLSVDTNVIANDRMSYAVNSARKFGCVVLLKGAPTFIADPSGQLYLNPTGNPGMATGGTGDVLSGIAGSLLAQGLDPVDAACLAAYIHGYAADLAADEIGTTSLIPTDIIAYLPEAFLALEE
jgi:NAD(P)H-hydrate epimerase